MDTKEKVFEVLKLISGMESIQENNSLKEDLAFDSLAMVTLLVEIEDAFEIELDEADMVKKNYTIEEDIDFTKAGIYVVTIKRHNSSCMFPIEIIDLSQIQD